MKYEVVITPAAEANLDHILHFIALDNPVAGRKFVAGLRNKLKSLASMPERCPLAPENGFDGVTIRHLLHGNYRLLFTVETERVIVLQIRHAARKAG